MNDDPFGNEITCFIAIFAVFALFVVVFLKVTIWYVRLVLRVQEERYSKLGIFKQEKRYRKK